MTLYDRIINLCENRGIKGGKLCADIGISKGTLTDLKMGRSKGLSAITAQKIASYFGVTVGYLLGEDESHFEISFLQAADKLSELITDSDFIEMYELYRKLNKENKQIVKGLIRDLI